MKKGYYTIGEVSRICKVSTKALRFYEKIGVISPDYVCEESGYRYYSHETLLAVPVLKYFKQMGFKLDEMQNFLMGGNYRYVQQHFRNKIDELRDREKEIHDSLIAVRNWYELVKEADQVNRYKTTDICVKFVSEESCYFMDQDFCYEYKTTVINIPWTNYLEELGKKITGPVILQFPSFTDKKTGKCKSVRIMQQAVAPDRKDPAQLLFGGRMAVCVYHIGGYEVIGQAYERIQKWADKRGYHCSPECYERYVVDYWTTRNTEEFVTEIIVPVSEKAEGGNEKTEVQRFP